MYEVNGRLEQEDARLMVSSQLSLLLVLWCTWLARRMSDTSRSASYSTTAKPSSERKKAIFLSGILWCYSLFWSRGACLRLVKLTCRRALERAVLWIGRRKKMVDVSYTVCLILACFVLPVTVMVYCYYKTHKALGELSKQAVQNWGENSRATHDTLQAERKMLWITVAITAGFLIAWTPYTLASIAAILKPGVVNNIGASIPAYIAKSSACYNPVIYVFMYRKVRSRLVGHPALAGVVGFSLL